MNLTSEQTALERYYQVVQTQKAALKLAENELRRRVAEHEEKRFSLLVERAMETGKGWCTLCHKVFPLDELHAAMSTYTVHTVCTKCGSTLPSLQKKDGVLWLSDFILKIREFEIREVGVMHQWSRKYPSNKRIPPELAAEFIPDVPEILLNANGTLKVGGKPYVLSAE